jgi:hypothetical protein
VLCSNEPVKGGRNKYLGRVLPSYPDPISITHISYCPLFPSNSIVLVGFGSTLRPCAARTRLFRLINANGALRSPRSCSLAAFLDIKRKSTKDDSLGGGVLTSVTASYNAAVGAWHYDIYNFFLYYNQTIISSASPCPISLPQIPYSTIWSPGHYNYRIVL